MQMIFSTVKRPEVSGPNVYAKHLLKDCLDSNQIGIQFLSLLWCSSYTFGQHRGQAEG